MTDNSEAGSKCLTKGANNFLGCKIDQNLTVTQGVMGFLNTVDTVDDPILEKQVDKAKWFAGVGTSGPAIVAGTMLIMFRIAMALFIGFGPIFILCLMFKKTAPLFQKWLYYGLATIFSGVMLAVMADIATDLVSKVALALFVSDNLLSLVSGNGSSGIMEAATQQLGLGLLLSTLLITVPPMAGMFFNGVMGAYYGTNHLGGWGGGGGQAVSGSGAGSGAHQVEQRTNLIRQQMDRNQSFQSETQVTNPLMQSGYDKAHSSDNSKTLAQAEKAASHAAMVDTARTHNSSNNSDKGKGGTA